MPTEERVLPLFPLNMVLFPGAPLPLHVFEERYRLMVQHCLDSDSLFGVALIKSGMEVGDPAVPYDVGTIARIAEVHTMDDGRMLLTNMGEQRYRVLEIVELRPYLRAFVATLEDEPPAELDPDLKERTRVLMTEHLRLLLGVRGGWVRNPKLPEDPVELSYFVCASLQAAPAEKQSLLENNSPTERLRQALDLVERDLPALRDYVARETANRTSNQ